MGSILGSICCIPTKAAGWFCQPYTLSRLPTLWPGDIVLVDTGYDNDLLLAVVVRLVYEGLYLVVPKYKVPPYWLGLHVTGFKRLVDTYSASSVRKASQLSGIPEVYAPQYATSIPSAPYSMIRVACSMAAGEAVEKLDILCKASCMKFCKVAEALSLLLPCIKVTGSLLHGGFVVGVSDIDLIIDISNANCLKALVEFIDSHERFGMPSEYIIEYLEREARARSLNGSIVRRAFRGWSRILVDGVTVSVSFADFIVRTQPYRAVVKLSSKVEERTVIVEPFQQSVGDYPHLAETSDGLLIMAYDGFYAPALFEGGKLRVRGLKAVYSNGRGSREALVVGVAEERTYITRE